MSRAYGDNKSEAAILLSVGAKVHKNSGRGMVKADGSDAMFVIDVKETEKSFTLNRKVWDKICSDAYNVDPNKNPQLLVVMGGTKRLAIIESYVLRGLQRENDALCNGYNDVMDDNLRLKDELIKVSKELRRVQKLLEAAKNDNA